MYYVFQKIDLVNGEIVRSLSGYVTSVEDKDTVVTNHCTDFCTWRGTNVLDLDSGATLLSDYTSFPAYELVWETTDIDGQDLSLITDFVNMN